MSRPSFFRTGLLSLGVAFAAGTLAITWLSMAACGSISETTPVPDTDASDFDGGFVPLPEDAGEQAPAAVVDTGAPPASARVRLANLLQGLPAVDLCVRVDPAAQPWEANWITVKSPNPKPEGLQIGEVSTHFFLPVAAAAGARYIFRVVQQGIPGGGCEGDGGAGNPFPAVSIPVQTLRQGGGLTIAAIGVLPGSGSDAGDAFARGLALTDTVIPAATSTALRVVHGVTDMPAFDVVINGETIPQLVGIRYGTAAGQPYAAANTSGFATIAAGVPEDSTLTLRAGTTVRSYKIPTRLRRGIATTIFMAGSLGGPPGVIAQMCSDRSPPDGEKTATCTQLQEIPQ